MQQGTFSKDQLKALKETLVQLLIDSGFDNQCKIKKTSINGYKSKQNFFKQSSKRNLIHSHKFVAASSLKAHQKENLAIFNKLKEEILKNLKEQGNEEISNAIEELNFTIGYSNGDKIQNLSGLEKIEFDNAGGTVVTDSEFKVEEGVVTLIDFWATWCGPCQGPMAHNESMLKKNEEKWKGKATIVGLSLDDESEEPIKRITEKDWKRVQHYRFKNGWDEENDDLKMFEINGIPFVVLLDKKGKIVFKGHPSECKLEEEINRLIDQEDVISQENVEDQNTLSQEEMIQKQYQKQSKLFFQDQWKQQLSLVDEIDGHFNILLEKSYTFSKVEVKTKMEYKKLAVDYKIGLQQKDWALSAVNLIKQTLNPASVSFEQEIIDDPQTDFQNHLSFFKTILETSNLPITLVENKTSKLEYSEGQFKETEISTFQQSEQLSSSLKDTIKKVNEELKQYYGKNAQRNVNKFEKIFKSGLSAQLDVNSQFAEIGNLHSLGQTETISLVHEEGKVLVIDFWAQWCGPCVSGLKKNTLLLQSKEEAWRGKVKFVAICLEDEKSSKEFLDKNTESQKQIEFMFMKDGRQNPAPTLYQVQYIPHYVIVGKNGKVKSLGSCSNLEETVQKLIDEESQGDLQSKEKVEKFSAKQIELLEELIKDKIHFAQVGESLKQVPFQFKLFVKKQSKLNLQTLKLEFKQIEEVGVQMWVRESKLAIIQGTLDKIYSIIPKEDLSLKIVIMKTVDIPFPGDKCQLCSKTLNDQTPQYYSHFSKEWYCVECTENDNEKEIGLDRYKVKDSVVFINAPLKDQSVFKDIDEYKLGKNLKIKEGEAGSQEHGFSCNNCGGQAVPGPRYIALSCRKGPLQDGGYVDLCFSCLKIWSQKTTDEAKKIIQENKNENLSEDTTWLRVLFSHGYYDF